jgi:hypothetical protein
VDLHPGYIDTNAIITVVLAVMKVEDPQQASALKHNELVVIMLPRDVLTYV